jgi:hypothetical protein
MPAGRPSKFKPEFVEQAEALSWHGATDAEIAEFFGVDLVVLAYWAMENEAFYDAITPTDAVKLANEISRTMASEKINRRRREVRAKLRPSPERRLKESMRARIWAALKGRSNGRLWGRLGYSLDDLRKHLASLMTEGMSWDNYGHWHVDHIKPCAAFNLEDDEEFRACWALSNLQPLWDRDNCVKGAKYAGAQG